jgi:hypothetical protein
VQDLWAFENFFVFTEQLVEFPVNDENFVRLDLALA